MMATRHALLLPFLLLAACDKPPEEDSSEIRARYKGRYTGPCNSWVTSPNTQQVYCASPALTFSTEAAYAAAAPKKADDSAYVGFDTKTPDEKLALLKAEGEKVYQAQCSACHGAAGAGVAGSFPPLAADPVANGGSTEEHITIVLKGLSGKTINGVAYTAAMTPFAGVLTDNQIAAVITHERTSWGNNGGMVEPAQVAAIRGK
jgi:mono/diheme cytochrome c family protein